MKTKGTRINVYLQRIAKRIRIMNQEIFFNSGNAKKLEVDDWTLKEILLDINSGDEELRKVSLLHLFHMLHNNENKLGFLRTLNNFIRIEQLKNGYFFLQFSKKGEKKQFIPKSLSFLLRKNVKFEEDSILFTYFKMDQNIKRITPAILKTILVKKKLKVTPDPKLRRIFLFVKLNEEEEATLLKKKSKEESSCKNDKTIKEGEEIYNKECQFLNFFQIKSFSEKDPQSEKSLEDKYIYRNITKNSLTERKLGRKLRTLMLKRKTNLRTSKAKFRFSSLNMSNSMKNKNTKGSDGYQSYQNAKLNHRSGFIVNNETSSVKSDDPQLKFKKLNEMSNKSNQEEEENHQNYSLFRNLKTSKHLPALNKNKPLAASISNGSKRDPRNRRTIVIENNLEPQKQVEKSDLEFIEKINSKGSKWKFYSSGKKRRQTLMISEPESPKNHPYRNSLSLKFQRRNSYRKMTISSDLKKPSPRVSKFGTSGFKK